MIPAGGVLYVYGEEMDQMVTRTMAQPDGTPTWMGLHVPDPDAARTFYQGLFGWEIADAASTQVDHQVATKDGQPVAGLVPGALPGAGAPSWTTYLATSSVDEAVSKIGANGGKVLEPVREGHQARTALVRDPGGAVFGLWQPGGLPGMGIWEESGALMWSENFTPDVEQAKAFYAAVFGLRYADPFPWHFGDPATAIPAYSMFATNGEAVDQSNAVGSLAPLDPHDPVDRPHWMPCFNTLSVQETADTAAQLGGTVLREPYDTMFGPLAIIADNQGAELMLAMKPPTS